MAACLHGMEVKLGPKGKALWWAGNVACLDSRLVSLVKLGEPLYDH